MTVPGNYIISIAELCKMHKVSFGSVLTEKFHKESDIDFIKNVIALTILQSRINREYAFLCVFRIKLVKF